MPDFLVKLSAPAAGTLGATLLHAILLLPVPATADIEVFDRWNPTRIEQLQRNSPPASAPGERVEFIAKAFLSTPYVADTLVGSATTPEEFVLRLDGVDCFTLLDYVEALRRSHDYDGFRTALREVRYRDGRVDFLARRHFFSDWVGQDSEWLADVTSRVAGARRTVRSLKQLNRRGDSNLFLPGYPVREREVVYIPRDMIDDEVLGRLLSGDYVGIYSEKPGLDVSHCGILVRRDGHLYLLHASSRQKTRKVVMEELALYLQGRPGLVVYRTRRPLSQP